MTNLHRLFYKYANFISCSLSGVCDILGAFLRRVFIARKIDVALAGASAALCLVAPAHGSHVRTQTFDLEAGWNAIYLAVEPLETSPADLFETLPIDIVTTFDQAVTIKQFTTNPDVDKLRELGWGIWYAPDREDAFLSDLGSIYGHKAYLVHATESVVFNLEGRVTAPPPSWKPNDFNLKGYTVDQLAPPTFFQFFSGSAAHNGQPIFRLVDGVWVQVQQPASTAMKSGEAFWIYCDGGSDFAGPLAVETGSAGLVVRAVGPIDLILRNRSMYPLQPTLEHIVDSDAGVPLAIEIQVIGEDQSSLSLVPVAVGSGAWTQPLPPLEADASIRIPFTLASEAALSEPTTSLLCIKTDIGTETWIPVSGLDEDLK